MPVVLCSEIPVAGRFGAFCCAPGKTCHPAQHCGPAMLIPAWRSTAGSVPTEPQRSARTIGDDPAEGAESVGSATLHAISPCLVLSVKTEEAAPEVGASDQVTYDIGQSRAGESLGMTLELALVGRSSQQPLVQGGHDLPCFEFILVARGRQCRIDFTSVRAQSLCDVPSDDAPPLLVIASNGSDDLL